MTNTAEKQQRTTELIQLAYDEYKEGLFALTSAGADSALLVHQLAEAKVKVPFLHIDTGFLFPQTIQFREQLSRTYDLDIHVIGPSPDIIAEIRAARLWERDIDQYRELTKLSPLNDAVNNLGITALIAAVRGDQTLNRSSLDFDTEGSFGERRIHPFLDWTNAEVDQYIDSQGLSRHPLYFEGYQSIDDWTLTVPGTGRSGRPSECGLHCSVGNMALASQIS